MPKKKKGSEASASSAADDDYDPDALLKVTTFRQECAFSVPLKKNEVD